MPCSTVHLLTAGRALADADRGGAALPFHTRDPLSRELFLHGALGPDMGFVPGADRFVSEVAHYVRSLDLARTLVSRASTAPESAFAWGWVTHVLTDLVLHPEVGRACGERLRGDRSLRLNAGEDLPTHVGMEVGLDLRILAGESVIPRPPPRSAFDNLSIRYLTGALEEVYGVAWAPEQLLATHRRSVVMNHRWPRALRVLEWGRGVANGAVGGIRGWVGQTAVGVGARLSHPEGAVHGFFHPIRPPDWLVDRTRTLADEFPERMAELVNGGLDSLPNHNLETGAPDATPLPHEDAERTAVRLAHLRGGGGVPAQGPSEAPG